MAGIIYRASTLGTARAYERSPHMEPNVGAVAALTVLNPGRPERRNPFQWIRGRRGSEHVHVSPSYQRLSNAAAFGTRHPERARGASLYATDEYGTIVGRVRKDLMRKNMRRNMSKSERRAFARAGGGGRARAAIGGGSAVDEAVRRAYEEHMRAGGGTTTTVTAEGGSGKKKRKGSKKRPIHAKKKTSRKGHRARGKGRARTTRKQVFFTGIKKIDDILARGRMPVMMPVLGSKKGGKIRTTIIDGKVARAFTKLRRPVVVRPRKTSKRSGKTSKPEGETQAAMAAMLAPAPAQAMAANPQMRLIGSARGRFKTRFLSSKSKRTSKRRSIPVFVPAHIIEMTLIRKTKKKTSKAATAT